MSNVREIRLAQNPLAGAADKMARDMPTLATAFAAIAQARKAYYDAHIDAGFTPDQALELVRSFSEQATPDYKRAEKIRELVGLDLGQGELP